MKRRIYTDIQMKGFDLIFAAMTHDEMLKFARMTIQEKGIDGLLVNGPDLAQKIAAETNTKYFEVLDNTIDFGIEFDDGYKSFWSHSTVGMEMRLKGFKKKDMKKEFEIILDNKIKIISLTVSEVYEFDKYGAYVKLSKVLSQADTQAEPYKELFEL